MQSLLDAVDVLLEGLCVETLDNQSDESFAHALNMCVAIVSFRLDSLHVCAFVRRAQISTILGDFLYLGDVLMHSEGFPYTFEE